MAQILVGELRDSRRRVVTNTAVTVSSKPVFAQICFETAAEAS